MTPECEPHCAVPFDQRSAGGERGRLPFTALLPRSWMADDLEAVRSASAKLAQGLISEEEYRHILKVGTRVLFVHLCNELAGEPKNASDLVITWPEKHTQWMVGTMSHATACASLVLARRKTAVCWRVVRACSLEHCVDLMANIISFCNVLLRAAPNSLCCPVVSTASLLCCATQSTTTGLANSCVLMPSRDPNNRLTRSHLACVRA